MVKNLPANAGDIRVLGLISGSGRSPGGGHGTYSSVLAWRVPWTEEPGGLQNIGSLRVGHDRSDSAHTNTIDSLVAQWERTCLSVQEMQVLDPWARNIPWRRKWQTTPIFLPGKSHGQR